MTCALAMTVACSHCGHIWFSGNTCSFYNRLVRISYLLRGGTPRASAFPPILLFFVWPSAQKKLFSPPRGTTFVTAVFRRFALIAHQPYHRSALARPLVYSLPILIRLLCRIPRCTRTGACIRRARTLPDFWKGGSNRPKKCIQSRGLPAQRRRRR